MEKATGDGAGEVNSSRFSFGDVFTPRTRNHHRNPHTNHHILYSHGIVPLLWRPSISHTVRTLSSTMCRSEAVAAAVGSEDVEAKAVVESAKVTAPALPPAPSSKSRPALVDSMACVRVEYVCGRRGEVGSLLESAGQIWART